MTFRTPAAKRDDIAPEVPRLQSVVASTLLVAWWLLVVASDLAGQQERRWNISAVPETEIGEAFGEDVYLFQSIASARFLPDGRIVVADKELLEIRIYGKDGKFQKRIGRRGQGPGEFSHIGGMWLTSRGMIAIWDARNRRITIYSSRGDRESMHRVLGNPAGGNLEVFFGSFGNDDVVLASLFSGRKVPGVNPDRWLLGRFGLDGDFRGPLGEVRGMWRFNGRSVPFSPMPASVVHRDSVYVADGYEGEIAVRDTRGVPVRTIGLPPVKEVPADAVWSSLEAQLRQPRKSSSKGLATLHVAYLENKVVPRQNQFPQVGGLLTDDDRGYIWAKAYDPYKDAIWLRASPMWPAAGGEWRVIRPDGGFVATVRMPETVRPLEIRGNRLLGVASDSLGVERIVVHAIQR